MQTLCLLSRDLLKVVNHYSIFHSSIVYVIYSTVGLSFSLNLFVVFYLWNGSRQACRQAGDICRAFNEYHKCFSNSTPSETSLPFTHTPKLQQWNEAGALCLAEHLYFPLLRRSERFLLWACIMEASSQSSSQQILWKDVSLFFLCLI